MSTTALNDSAAEQANPTRNIVVRKMTEFQSKNYGIYINNVLVEGGFFSKHAADIAASQY